jgi:WD40 repeat protein
MMTRQRLISILTTLTLAALTSACGGLLPGNRSSGAAPTAPIRGPMAGLGEGKLKTLAVSPDGTLAAVATSLGIALYDLSARQFVRVLAPARGVERVAFSPDGRLLAAGVFVGRTTDREERGGVQMETSRVKIAIRLWQVADGAAIGTFDAHNSSIYGLAFSPDGQLLASGGHDDSVKLWRVSDGALRFSFTHPRVFDVAFTPDGALLAATGNEPFIPLWRVRDGAPLRRLPAPAASNIPLVTGLAFSPDSRRIAASYDVTAPKARVWETSSGRVLHTLAGHTLPVTGVAFAPDGQMLATSSRDRTVRLWHADSGAPAGILEGHSDAVWCVSFAPDGALLASGDRSGATLLWSLPAP